MECVLCGNEVESICHLFVHCHVVQGILFACPLSLRLQNSTDTTIRELVASWLSAQDVNYIFNMGACMMWPIWRAMNELIKKHTFSLQLCLNPAVASTLVCI